MTRFTLSPTEHDEQVMLFEWAAWIPKLKLLHAIPNGGFRHPATAARLKAEGVKAGIPDVHLPVASRGWHGLYLELKRVKGGRLSPQQEEFIKLLKDEGLRVEVCRGFDAAREAIEDYLGG